MADLKAGLRKLAIYVTAVIAGISIFAAIASVLLENTLFNQIMHKKLFERYGIYTYTGNAARNYFKEYSKNLAGNSLEGLKQQEELVSLINRVLTPEMISLNINSAMDGFVSYFKNETRFLPDLYLKPVGESGTQEEASGPSALPAVRSLSGIDRINTSIILMYMNRTDITDKLMVVKLFQFALSRLPVLSCIIFALCLLCGYIASTKKHHRLKWIKTTLLTSGFIFFISAAAFLVFIYIYIPGSEQVKSMLSILPEWTVNSYVKDWFFPYVLVLSALGVIAAILVHLSTWSLKTVKSTRLYIAADRLSAKVGTNAICNMRKHAKIVACPVFLLMILLFSLLQLQITRNEFRTKDLTVALDRMKGITAFSRVVYARDAAVYALEIKIIDKKTEMPVQDIQMHIAGKAVLKGTEYDLLKTSDSDGRAKVLLDEGSFNIDFDYNKFPKEYIVPSPYYFKLESAGTTVITISLEKTEPKNPGIIEVQILDKGNKPIGGLELELGPVGPEENQTGKIFSFTNSEGIAAFRTAEGKYKAAILVSAFTEGYEIPQPLNVEAVSDVTARYTYKLVQKAAEKPQQNRP